MPGKQTREQTQIRSRKAKQRKGVSKAKPIAPPVIRTGTAGIDIGATEIYVAVAPDRDAEPVRCFTSFTADLEGLTGWLRECGVTSVAMESTGVYWIPLHQTLADAGIEVCLVNAGAFRAYRCHGLTRAAIFHGPAAPMVPPFRMPERLVG